MAQASQGYDRGDRDRHRSSGVPREQRERERAEREERRAAREAQRSSQLAIPQTAAAQIASQSASIQPIPPSPALVRNGSKQRKSSGTMNDPTRSRTSQAENYFGTNTQQSSIAPPVSPDPRRAASGGQQQHPYTQQNNDSSNIPNDSYPRPNPVPVTERSIMNSTPVNNAGGDHRAFNGHGDTLDEDDNGHPKTFGQKLADLFTCKCG